MSFIRRIIIRIAKKIYSWGSAVKKPIDESKVEILTNINFRESLKEIGDYSLLDTDRLANLWEYCRLSNPEGAIFEIGSYKGGGALHLSNAAPGRKVYIFDSFNKSFEKLDQALDYNFNMDQFKDTSIESVRNLFLEKKREYEIVNGFFPQSFQNHKFPKVSFVHLDVDIYKATIESLLFLDSRMADKSFIIIDDYNRNCEGVNKAVEEFTSQTDNWRAFPLFPSQGLLVHKSWFS